MNHIVNLHLKQPLPETPVSATLIEHEDEQLDCLLRVAGVHCAALECAIFQWMRDLCAAYAGGRWRFYTLSNGGFYMAPEASGFYALACPNHFEAEVSADTAGVIACAYAYSHLSFESGSRFADAYQRLSVFIFQHPDAALIRAALD